MKDLSGAVISACRHCRTKFRPTQAENEFCCPGCRYVFQLIHGRGLEEFYRYGDRLFPAGSFVFHERDFHWLDPLQSRAEKSGTGQAEMILEVQGVSCAGCVWLLEAVFGKIPGAVSCRVQPAQGRIRLRWDCGSLRISDYAREVQRFGYLLGTERAKPESFLPALTRRMGLCGFLAMNGMVLAIPRYFGLSSSEPFAAVLDLLSFLVATASLLLGGSYFIRRSWTSLWARQLHIDLPISLGLLFAYGASVVSWLKNQYNLNYFEFVSTFTFLMILGRWLQERSLEENRQRLLGMRLLPDPVLRGDGETKTEFPCQEIREGDSFRVPRNGLVPVRARLCGASATFALNWITGEPAPCTYSAGAIVPSGARSLENGQIRMQALENWESSQLSALHRVDSQREWRDPHLEQIMQAYLWVVLAAGLSGGLLWTILGHDGFRGLQVAISVLVVSCPCALGVALPLLADLAATILQAYGVFVREGTIWSRLKRVHAVLLDKTGTVTLETLRLQNPEAVTNLSPRAREALMWLVHQSLHPVAATLREEILSRGFPATEEAGQVEEVSGKGLAWSSQDGIWRLGRPEWCGVAGSPDGTVLALDGKEISRFHFHEELRPESTAQIEQLRRQKLSIYLLSGDAPQRVKEIGRQLGIPDHHAFGGLLPEEKADLIKRRWPDCALMVGDGANDSLAFDAALCRGTPAVDTGWLEHKADFYLLGRGLGGLPILFEAARRVSFSTRTVFGFAILYNITAAGTALAGWMNPLIAAVIMPSSSLITMGMVRLTFRSPFLRT